ncbi:hypothetical protein AMD27_16735 (plasmid) [Acinetobacter sp. TGL-Y2]|uniref:hypothetical protein n=1 Tax=Acinetobacter sp. TGL-Y2 TaxID=1407071 RepID=UPI0007A65955|nr:hypothetical protein [Acinetobacter sp. TGL-Y2]AMW80563.1 hypothetical protein AMD27_16735 [Acinetobacter sp. TGL-Y2]
MKLIYILLIGAVAIHTMKFFANRADYAEVYLKDCTEISDYCTVLKGKLRTDYFTREYIISSPNGTAYLVNERAIARIKYPDHELILDIKAISGIDNEKKVPHYVEKETEKTVIADSDL